MTKNYFRAIVIISIVYLIVAGVLVLNFNQVLPPELDAYAYEQSNEVFELISFAGFMVAFMAGAANIGLLFFARWARPVFSMCVIGASLATAFDGPFVATALEATIYELGLLLDGFIIALMYFSEAKKHFERGAT